MLPIGFLLLYTVLVAAQSEKYAVKICMEEDELTVLGTPTENETITSNCTDYGVHYSGFPNMKVKKSIESFKKGWYRLEYNLYSIDLSDNEIRKVTKEMLASLPFGIGKIILRANKIRMLRKKIFTKRHLNWLDLSSNFIYKIETGTFEKLKELQYLNLDGNQLRDLKFAATLPPNLKWLYINDNCIRMIPGHAFWRLSKLNMLELHRNLITTISVVAFVGLTDIKHIDLSWNPLCDYRPYKILPKSARW